MKRLVKIFALAMVLIAGAVQLYAQCPSVYEYIREDGVRRVCGLRSADSFGSFCLYNCISAPN